MNGLMGDWTCKPVEERGIYAVYLKGDIAALKERCRRLKREHAAAVHENALLHEKLNRYERAACYRESEREAENMRERG